jgi:hypothetical protein
VANRNADRVGDQLLHLGRGRFRAEAGPQLHPIRFAQWDDRELEDDPVGHHDPVRAAHQGGVEEAERGHYPLHLAGELAADQAHALADPERPCRLKDDSGKEVRHRLLRGEADHDRREGPSDRQRTGVEPGDPQRDGHHHHDRPEAEQEAHRPRRAGIHATEEGRSDPATRHSREAPAEDHETADCGDPDLRVEAWEQFLAMVEGQQHRGDQHADQHESPAGPLRLGSVDLGAQADLTPFLGSALEVWRPPEIWGYARQTPRWHYSRVSQLSRPLTRVVAG